MGVLARIPIVLVLCGLAAASARGQGMWVTGYYPGWGQNHLSPENIDFGAVTHLVHFSVLPRADGSLDASTNLLTQENIKAVVMAAHGAGKKVLFAVGGQDTRAQFEAAMSRTRRTAFIAALVSFLRDNGYDGIDIDMEDLPARDAHAYARFIRELRAKLDRLTPRPLLTAAVLWEPGLFARLAGDFDQINLMSYNLSGPYPGWVVWHSGSLYDGGLRFPNGQAALPSVEGLVESFLDAGVPKPKLGVGLSFDGYVWSGSDVSRPGQAWKTPPSVKNVPYYSLAETYGIKESDEDSPGYHWDPDAQAAYLSIEAAGGTGAQFVSFNNEVSAGKMVRYIRNRALGGLIVWDLGAGYRADQPPDHRDGLLQAVKKARLAFEGGIP